MKKMRKTAIGKRIFVLLLAGIMFAGELGSMEVMAAGITGMAAEGEKPDTESGTQEEIPSGEETEGDTSSDDVPAGETPSQNTPDEDTPEEGGSEGEAAATPGEETEEKETDREEMDGEEILPEEDGALEPSVSMDMLTDGNALSAPENLRVLPYAGFGSVYLKWDYACDPTETARFEIYRASEPEGDYQQIDTKWADDTRTEWEYSVTVPIDPATGNNGIYYYKVKACPASGTELTESAFSNIATNAGIPVGSGYEETDYKNICFIDADGNRIDKLTIHEGESIRVGIGLVRKDDSIVHLESLEEQLKKCYYHSDWSIVTFSDDDDETSEKYIKIPLTEERRKGYANWITAEKCLTAGQSPYYIEIATQAHGVYGYFAMRLPVEILKAESGETYDKAPERKLCTTKQEAYAEARSLIRAREHGTVWVKKGVFFQDQPAGSFSTEALYDTYKERADMKPDEGDYMLAAIGDRNKKGGEINLITEYEYSSIDGCYDVYYFTLPYYTTRAEEDAVDAKIKDLLAPGGDLDPAQYENDREKVNAIYTYIRTHGRHQLSTDPDLHSCYSLLINGTGTCEAFSLLFMRLAREMGIASRMINTELDRQGNNHAYNIVRLDDEDGTEAWYYIDTSVGKPLCDGNTFKSDYNLAPIYRDQRFINEYFSKIPGEDYEYVGSGTFKVEDSAGSSEEFDNLDDANDYIQKEAEKEENKERTYTLSIQDGNIISYDFLRDALDFGDCASRVSVDLGGNAIQIEDDNTLEIRAKEVRNGTITIGSCATLGLNSYKQNGGDSAQSEYSDLKIYWKQTTDYIEYEYKMCTVTITGYENEAALHMADSVKISGISLMGISGNIVLDNDFTAETIECLVGDITLNGTVKATEGLTVGCDRLTVNRLTASGTNEFRNIPEVTVTGMLSLLGVTSIYDNGYGKDVSYLASVRLVKKYDSDSKLLSEGRFALTGELDFIPDQSDGLEEGITLFHFIPMEEKEGIQTESAGFHPGDVLGTLTKIELICVEEHWEWDQEDIRTPVGVLDETNVTKYFSYQPASDTQGALELDEEILWIGTECVRVTYHNEENGAAQDEPVKSAVYSSLSKAVKNLDGLAGKAVGTYTFTFVNNGMLSKDITLPSYVSRAVFNTEAAEDDNGQSDSGQEWKFDFMGHSLTAAGDVEINDTLHLVSSIDKAGEMKLPKKKLILTTQSPDDSKAAYILNTEITADTLCVNAGNWQISKATVTTMQVDADSRLEISDASVKNLTLRDNALLVTDSLSQLKGGMTKLGADSRLLVREKLILCNTTLTGTADAHLYRKQGAALSLNGGLKQNPDTGAKLAIGLLADGTGETAGTIQCQDFKGEMVIFSTDIKEFPLELLQIEQGEQSRYNMLYQLGSDVYVGTANFTLVFCDTDGKEIQEREQSFSKWADVSDWLKENANTSETYIVQVLDDVDIHTALTLPSKVKEIIFRSGKEDNAKAELTCTGDIKLFTDTTFQGVTLHAVNAKNNKALASLNANGKKLTMDNAEADFAKITNAKSIELTDASLSAEAAIAVKDTLIMKSAALESGSKIEVKNIVTIDAHNKLIYGGNQSGSLLKITGTVTSVGEGNETEQITSADGSDVMVRIAAIDLEPQDATADRDGNTLLCEAAKAGSAWFVIGSEWTQEGRTVSHAAYKKGKNIYQGKKTGVILKTSDSGEQDSYCIVGSFAELQEALSEIDRLADAEKYYYIVLEDDEEGTVTSSSKALTMPSKAACVTIGSSAANKNIYYTKAFTLKSNVVLEHITLNPAGKSAISIGKFALTMNACKFAEDAIVSGITGSGPTGPGTLTLTDSTITVDGAVNKIGTLRLNNAGLTVKGDINIGKLESDVNGLPGGSSKNSALTGLAAVTRDKTDKITKIVPKFTIAGTITVNPQFPVTIGLYEAKKSGKETSYEAIVFPAEGLEEVMLAKAVYAKPKDFNLNDSNISTQEGAVTVDTGILTKKNGYLTWVSNADSTVILSYIEDTQTAGEAQTIDIPCKTFADAVAEINSLKTKQDYTISLTSDISKNPPAALTMPKKNTVDRLTIRPQYTDTGNADNTGNTGSAPRTVTLPYLGNITLTSDVVFENISFEQMVKDGGSYASVKTKAEDYPKPMTLSTGGFCLTIAGEVTFDTPLSLNGGKLGELCIEKNARLFTDTNAIQSSDMSEAQQSGEGGGADTMFTSIVLGFVKNFKKIEVSGQNLSLKQYGTKSAQGDIKYTAAELNVTELTIAESGEVSVDGNAVVQTLTIGDGALRVSAVKDGKTTGKATFTNVILTGKSRIYADRDFKINTKLTSSTSGAILYTRRQEPTQKEPVRAPYLNVAGKIDLRGNLENRIKVAVYDALDPSKSTQNFINEEPAELAIGSGASASAQLLTARYGDGSTFLPIQDNVPGKQLYVWGQSEQSEHDSYLLVKAKNNIYVYSVDAYNADEGTGGKSGAVIALCQGKVQGNSLDNASVMNYYRSWQDAVSAINGYDNRNAEYTLALLADIGAQDAPLSLTMPSKAEAVYVISVDTAGENNAGHNLYYGKAISLGTNTIFSNVTLCPTAKGEGASLGFSTGKNALTLQNIMLSSASGTAIKDIAGKGTIILDTPDIVINGSINGASELTLKQNAVISGTLKVTKLNLSGTGSGVQLTLNSSAAITDITNSGTAQNTIVYGRTAKDAPNLTINGNISGENIQPLCLDMKAAGKNVSDYMLSIDQAAGKVILNNDKMLAGMTKAPTSAYTCSINGSAVTAPVKVVKANKSVYLIDESLQKYTVKLTSEAEVSAAEAGSAGVLETETLCLDFTQAVNEINARADSKQEYVLTLTQDCADTNITDTNDHSALTLPTKAKLVTITSDADSLSGKAGYNLFFTGAVVTLRCDTTFEGVGLTALKKGKTVPYETASYNISAGNYRLIQSRILAEGTMDEKAYLNSPAKVTGTAKGSYIFRPGAETGDVSGKQVFLLSPADSVNGFGTVTLQNGNQSAEDTVQTADAANAVCVIAVPNGVSKINHLILEPGVILKCENGAAAVKDMTLTNSMIEAKNITAAGTVTMTDSVISAFTPGAGDGKCKLANVRVAGGENTLKAKQNNKKVSQIEVTGTVTKAEALQGTLREIVPNTALLTIAVFPYNVDETTSDKTAYTYEPLSNNMILLTAPKSAARYFKPLYTTTDAAGMGESQEGYGVYKSGKLIKYGRQ